MNLNYRRHGTVGIIALAGRFDAHETPLVSARLAEAAKRSPGRLVVNLSGVNFIDSAALASLTQAMKRCRQAGGDLHLCALQDPVQVIFDLTRLNRAFRIFDDEHEAIAEHG